MMLRILIIICIGFLSAEACKMQWVYGKRAQGCMVVEGKKREFRYFMPTHAKGVVLPLVIGLHGGGGKPKQFEKYSRFSQLSEKFASFIVVYPKGVNKHWNDGRSNLNHGIDDVKFISRLIDMVPHTEKGEVYVTGMSNGGLMTQRLACEISPKLKGIAVVAATMSTHLQKHCPNTKPLETLFIFGTKDSAFLKNGHIVSPLAQAKVRGTHIGIEKTLSYWAKRNSCKGLKLNKTLTLHSKKWGRFKEDGTKVFVHHYRSCKKRLGYYKVDGGGHRWPDEKASNGFVMRKAMKLGIASHEINAAEEIIDFWRLIKR